MTIIDYISIILVIYFAINGFKKGFVHEVLSLLSLIGAIYLANLYYLPISNSIKIYFFKQVALTDEIIMIISNTVAYVLIILGVLILFKFLFIPAIRMVFRLILTKTIDSILGIIFGFMKGVVISAILLNLLFLIKPGTHSLLYQKYFKYISLENLQTK